MKGRNVQVVIKRKIHQISRKAKEAVQLNVREAGQEFVLAVALEVVLVAVDLVFAVVAVDLVVVVVAVDLVFAVVKVDLVIVLVAVDLMVIVVAVDLVLAAKVGPAVVLVAILIK